MFALVWFGLLVVIVAEIGLITPPIGINLFVIKSMAPDIRIQNIFSGVVPFIVADLFRVTIIVLFPGIVLWLPGLLF
jgi:TRAP-type C4-dicarboxylate transport system permease large subunit